MNKIRNLLYYIVSFTLFLSPMSTLLATEHDKDTDKPLNIPNPINAKSVPELVQNIVTTVLGIVGALALIMFIYGGILWLTSLGNKERIKKGQDVLVWATIGLLIIFGSYAILQLVFQALGGTAK